MYLLYLPMEEAKILWFAPNQKSEIKELPKGGVKSRKCDDELGEASFSFVWMGQMC